MSEFTPESGYSRNRTSTVFTDGDNRQRAEFTYGLSGDWTPESFDKDRTSVLLSNGSDEQRAVVVYNIGGGSGSDSHNMGWFADESALTTAYPIGNDGDYAIVGTTDTIWVWDSDGSEWVDTDQKGQVESVNNKTGQVTLDADDVGAVAVPDRVAVSGTGVTIAMVDNKIYSCSASDITSISFSNPSSPTTDYVCQVIFTSGATATTVGTNTFKWFGNDVNENGDFVPKANCKYSILFTYDDAYVRGMVQGLNL